MDVHRLNLIASRMIERLDLNLSGLSVLTEAASGHYLFTPILAALAGAETVYCLTKDSHFANKEEVKTETISLAKKFGVEDKIQITFEKKPEWIVEADIITNSGFVRPINEPMIKSMKPTAVIPLMWETWEYREDDLDLKACKKYEIPVLGTHESVPPCDLKSVAGFLALKLLFELGLEGYETNVLLLGGQHTLGESIYQNFVQQGLHIAWFGDNAHRSCQSYQDLTRFFQQYGQNYDVILVAEHANSMLLLGKQGRLPFEVIQQINPAISIGVISGNIAIDELIQSNLKYFPKHIMPFGYMSYQAYALGPKPVLQLYAAGLKVGEIMARARINGLSTIETIRHAMMHPLPMDFKGDQAWLTN